MVDDPNKNAKRLVLLFWVMAAFYYFYVSYDYISTDMKNDKLGAYVNHVVQLAGNETRTPREVRSLLLVKADELQIPLAPEQINILGSGQSLKVSLEYDVSIDIPILARGFFSRHFVHNVSYRQPR